MKIKAILKRGLCIFSSVLLVCLFSIAPAGQVSATEGLTKIADNVYSYAGVKKASPANSFGANSGIVI